MKVILATASKKCAELLKLMNIDYEAVDPHLDETLVTGKRLPPTEVARALAAQKAVTAFKYYPNSTVLGLDTIVCVEGELLGFPKSKEDAKSMLRKLSGRSHDVYTGVHMVSDYIEITFSTKTSVDVLPMTEEEIQRYVDSTDEYMTCAGGYRMDGKAAAFIEHVNGDYNNCLGLPVCELKRKLREHGMRV